MTAGREDRAGRDHTDRPGSPNPDPNHPIEASECASGRKMPMEIENPIPTGPADEPVTDPVEALLAEAGAIVGAVAAAETSFVPLRKRANRALDDLRLLALLGRDWIGLDGDLVVFRPIDRRTFERLVRLLEDLEPVAEPAPQPGPGQLPLLFPPTFTPPPPITTTLHAEVTR